MAILTNQTMALNVKWNPYSFVKKELMKDLLGQQTIKWKVAKLKWVHRKKEIWLWWNLKKKRNKTNYEVRKIIQKANIPGKQNLGSDWQTQHATDCPD